MKKLNQFLLICFLLFSLGVKAQDYKFHSVFIYNFTKYIQWPAEYQNGEFVIGVLGNSEITGNLKKMAEIKTVGSQKIAVKEYSDISEVSKCHILFIPSSKSKELENALAKVNSQPTLIITERPGLGEKGSGINFITVDGKLNIELNKSVLESAGLKIASQLMALAKVV